MNDQRIRCLWKTGPYLDLRSGRGRPLLDEMSSGLGINLHNIYNPTSSDTFASQPDKLEKLPAELRNNIEEQYGLLERHPEIEKDFHSRIATQDFSTVELSHVYRQELARVLYYIEQAQRLGHQLSLARVLVTACYYREHFESMVLRARERLADFEVYKELLLSQLEHWEDTSDQEERQSKSGLPESSKPVRQLGKMAHEHASGLPVARGGSSGMSQSTTNGNQVNETAKVLIFV